MLTQLQNTVQRLSGLVNDVNQTGSPLVAKIVDQFNDAADKRVDHIFWRLIQLFSIIAVFVIVIVVVRNLSKRREVHQSNIT